MQHHGEILAQEQPRQVGKQMCPHITCKNMKLLLGSTFALFSLTAAFQLDKSNVQKAVFSSRGIVHRYVLYARMGRRLVGVVPLGRAAEAVAIFQTVSKLYDEP